MIATAALSIDAALFEDLMCQLAARGGGVRESGAFLLADRNLSTADLPRRVCTVAYYDDLDPGCLTGAIDFGADGYSALADLCRARALCVVADIHSHPGHVTAQSSIDAAHPMVALDGHVALIAPHFATGVTGPSELGVHVRRDGGWVSFYDAAAADVVVVVAVRDRRPAGRRSWWARAAAWLDSLWWRRK